jgi:hypothetical protein
MQESLAMLKILAQSTSSISKGNIKPAGAAFNDLREKINWGNQ